MKVLQGFGIAILSIVLFFLTMTLVLSMSVKDIFQNNIIGAAVKEGIKEGTAEKSKSLNNDDLNKFINNIMDDPEMNNIIDSVISEMTTYNTTHEVSDKTVDLFYNFVIKHKSDIEALANDELDFSKLDTEEGKKEFRDGIKNGLNEVMDENSIEGSDADTLIEGIKVYNTITSKQFIIGMVSVIIVIIGLIALVSWSYYKWLLPTGVVSIVSSIFTFIYYGGLSLISAALKESVDFEITIASGVVLVSAIMLLMIGIAFIVLHSVLNKKELETIRNNQMTTV